MKQLHTYLLDIAEELEESSPSDPRVGVLRKIAGQVQEMEGRALSWRDQLLHAQNRLHRMEYPMPWQCFWFGHVSEQGYRVDGYEVCARCGMCDSAAYDGEAYHAVSWLAYRSRRLKVLAADLHSWQKTLVWCAQTYLRLARVDEAVLQEDLHYTWTHEVVDPVRMRVRPLLRRIVPRRCHVCGRRWGCDGDCDIPF